MAAETKVEYTKLFINNEWCDSASGKTFPTINPANNQEICQLQEADKVDVDLAVKAARDAFEFGSEWRSMAAAQRSALMGKLVELVQRDSDKLARLITLDMGKTLKAAQFEAMFSAATLAYYAGWPDKVTGKTLQPGASEDAFFAYTRHEPIGVCGAIIPWNYPLAMIAWKIGPALACGCTMVMKAAEQSPLVGLHMAALIKEAGFPPGVFNLVNGYGPTAGAAISEHMDIDKVAFTGSVETGRLVMQAAAKSNLKKVSLELGGKSPLIIFPDVDLDEAVKTAHGAIFTNNGQVCSAGSRVFVHEDIYDKFVAKAVETAVKSNVTNPMEEDADNGSMVDEQQYNVVLDLIVKGVDEGAALKCGGKKIEREGFYIQPTVFADVTDEMTIAKQEIFGPVQSILKFKDTDEVIKRANATTYGLGSGVLTNDLKTAIKVVNRLQAGSVWVNCYNMIFPTTPFGGYKQSGIGRELGEYAIKEYTTVKSVVMNIA
ncbi:aldehyde dehydrogenase 1A1-like [Clytia hemisphaerica]|uniref:Aldehyde dehydrogenase domain-containing protein n=1 Tax=Clytia hemisphaerica TaxID=252671 RepID=A0A7M5XE11_9CNID